MDYTNETKIKEREEKQKIKIAQELNDLRKLLKLPQGRRFIWRFFEYCKIYQSAFTGSSVTYYNEGRQDVGKFLLGEVMRADRKAFAKMQEEYWGKNIEEQE